MGNTLITNNDNYYFFQEEVKPHLRYGPSNADAFACCTSIYDNFLDIPYRLLYLLPEH